MSSAKYWLIAQKYPKNNHVKFGLSERYSMFECLFLYVLGAKVFEGPIEKIHFSSKMVFVFLYDLFRHFNMKNPASSSKPHLRD